MNKLKQILIGITLLSIISILNLQAQTSFNAIDDNNFQLVEKTSEDKLFHCEVPCGIFNDKLRIELVKEHRKINETNKPAFKRRKNKL